MKTIVVGAGGVGVQVARQLISEHKDVVIIERNSDVAYHIGNSLDCLVIAGEASSRDVLRRAGIGEAEYFIAVTGSDETNMIACSIVAQESAQAAGPVKIARVRNPSYASLLDAAGGPFLGIDFAINPEIEAAKAIMRAIDRGVIGDASDLAARDLRLQAMHVGTDFPYRAKPLRLMRQEINQDFIVPVIVRDRDFLIPTGETVLEEGDELYVLGSQKTLDEVLAALGRPRVEFRRVAIFGGGRIGSYLVEELLGGARERRSPLRRFLRALTGRTRPQVTVFEQSIERCKELSERFPDALINHLDITEEGALAEEQLASYDLAAAVTGDQELNLVAAAHAKVHGARRTIALVTNNDYLKVAREMPIDVTVSLRDNVARTVLAIIRKGVIRTLHSVVDSEIEILELAISEGTRLAGKRIRDAGLPRDTLILFVVRGGKTILPDGNFVLQPDDRIAVIAHKSGIQKIESRFLART